MKKVTVIRTCDRCLGSCDAQELDPASAAEKLAVGSESALSAGAEPDFSLAMGDRKVVFADLCEGCKGAVANLVDKIDLAKDAPASAEGKAKGKAKGKTKADAKPDASPDAADDGVLS